MQTTEQAIKLIETALEVAETQCVKELKQCKEYRNRREILAEFDALERVSKKLKVLIQQNNRGKHD